MDWRITAGIGALLVVGGVLFALLEVGVLFIADCGPDCQARGEQVAVIALALGGVAVAVGGAFLLRRGLRARPRVAGRR